MEEIIKIESLNKHYGSVHAVRDLSFSVKEGELFAFLGVNGAGKSTTINMMCGTLPCDSGKIVICGADINREPDMIKRNIGVVFQNSVLDSNLSVVDNLRSRATLYGIHGAEFKSRLDELSRLLGFSDFMTRPLGKLSGGQRRRADIARALFHKPRVLVLDEPTTGLDPQTRMNLWEIIGQLRKKDGLTVFLTTHYMEEAADADNVVIIDSGVKAAEGTPLELKNKYTGDYITLYGADENEVRSLGCPTQVLGGAVRITVPNTAAAAELIRRKPELFADFEITKGKMDDVFLAVTGKKLVGGNEK